MFGRDKGVRAKVVERASSVKDTVTHAAGAGVRYVDPLARDEKLRRRLAAAIVAGSAARRRARRLSGITGLAERLAADTTFRSQLGEVAMQLRGVQKRTKRAQSHKLRTGVLLACGIGIAVAAVPAARTRVGSLIRGGGDDWSPDAWSDGAASADGHVAERAATASLDEMS